MKHTLPANFINQPLRLAVAGCGGNGSQMLSGLARMHIALTSLGHPGLAVTAFDPDTVSEANIGRQLFARADIGQHKATVLVNRLNAFYGLGWSASAARAVDPDDFTLLISCVDSIKARQRMALTKCHYWLDLGNSDQTGQVILGQTPAMHKQANGYRHAPSGQDRLPSVLDVFPSLTEPDAKEDNTPSCSLAEALEKQDLFVNQWIATAALQLLWSFIRQGGLDIHGYFINLQTNRVTPLPIK